MRIRIVGVDPALRNTGLAIATYDIVTGDWNVWGLNLIKTESQKGKTVRASSDDYRCACEMRAGVVKFVKDNDARIMFAEIPSGTQSARGSMSNGISLGVLAGSPVPLIEVSPTETKVAAVGHKHAAKEEMIEWATQKWPEAAGWLTKKMKGEVSYIAANEHLADACGIIAAGIKTPQFKQAVEMMRVASGFALAA